MANMNSDMIDQREEKVAKEQEWRLREIAGLEGNCDDMRAEINWLQQQLDEMGGNENNLVQGEEMDAAAGDNKVKKEQLELQLKGSQGALAAFVKEIEYNEQCLRVYVKYIRMFGENPDKDDAEVRVERLAQLENETGLRMPTSIDFYDSDDD